jgi:hypothetical protein
MRGKGRIPRVGAPGGLERLLAEAERPPFRATAAPVRGHERHVR